MIQVFEISCVKKENVEFDDYVPITVRWGANEKVLIESYIGGQEILKNRYLRWGFQNKMEV